MCLFHDFQAGRAADVEDVGGSSADGGDLCEMNGNAVSREGLGHVKEKAGAVGGCDFDDGVEIAALVVDGYHGAEFRPCSGFSERGFPLPIKSGGDVELAGESVTDGSVDPRPDFFSKEVFRRCADGDDVDSGSIVPGEQFG